MCPEGQSQTEAKHHILLADDDPNDILILRRSLEAAGVSNPLIVVRDGAEAVDYLAGQGRYVNRQQFPLPRVMLLDLKMPKLDGFDVLRWCRDQKQEFSFSIIVLSGSALPQDIEQARALGARAYRVKPTDAEGLVRLAEEVRDHWLRSASMHKPTDANGTQFFVPDLPFND